MHKEIIINPRGERFYLVECDAYASVFTNATLSVSDEGIYEIVGTQILYGEHKCKSRSRKKLLCRHPEELIRWHSFLGVFRWYSVNGVLMREVIARYLCQHKEYRIYVRLEFLSHICTEGI